LTIVVAAVALVLLWRVRLTSARAIAGDALIGAVHTVL
jgi:hypothetical protein